MTQSQLLSKVADTPKNSIANGVKVALEQHVKEEEIMKMLKSMVFDNERLFVRDFGIEIVEEIKSHA